TDAPVRSKSSRKGGSRGKARGDGRSTCSWSRPAQCWFRMTRPAPYTGSRTRRATPESRIRAHMKTGFVIAAGVFLLVGAAAGDTHTWTGAVNSLWSNNGNWTGGTPAGDPAADLVFPAGPAQLVSTDDIAGVTFLNSITFSGTSYTINAMPGNSIALAGNISVREATSNTLVLPIALFGGTAHSTSRLGLNRDTSSLLVLGVISGPASDPLNLFSVGGFSSGGLFDVTFSADNTYSGTTTVSAGVPGFLRLYVLGNQPNSAVTGGSISQNAHARGPG